MEAGVQGFFTTAMMHAHHTLLALTVASALLYVYRDRQGQRGLAPLLKPLPIFLCMVTAIVFGAPSDAQTILLVGALALSAVGDIFLLDKSRYLLQGLSAFLCAHVLFVALFTLPVGFRPSQLFLLAPIAAVAIIPARLLDAVPGRLRIPLAAYTLFIALMGWRALCRARLEGIPWGEGNTEILFALGALLFVASDTLLGLNRFRKGFDAGNTAVLATYYAAQITFTHALIRA